MKDGGVRTAATWRIAIFADFEATARKMDLLFLGCKWKKRGRNCTKRRGSGDAPGSWPFFPFYDDGCETGCGDRGGIGCRGKRPEHCTYILSATDARNVDNKVQEIRTKESCSLAL